MGAHLGDGPLSEHDDQIGRAYGRVAVRDEHRDAAAARRRVDLAASVYRSNSAASLNASRAAVGSSRTSSSGVARIIERPRATFCHCPPESSTPSLNLRPSWVLSRSGSTSTMSAASGAPESGDDSLAVIEVLERPDADRVLEGELEPGEVLEPGRGPSPPLLRVDRF